MHTLSTATSAASAQAEGCNPIVTMDSVRIVCTAAQKATLEVRFRQVADSFQSIFFATVCDNLGINNEGAATTVYVSGDSVLKVKLDDIWKEMVTMKKAQAVDDSVFLFAEDGNVSLLAERPELVATQTKQKASRKSASSDQKVCDSGLRSFRDFSNRNVRPAVSLLTSSCVEAEAARHHKPRVQALQRLLVACAPLNLTLVEALESLLDKVTDDSDKARLQQDIADLRSVKDKFINQSITYVKYTNALEVCAVSCSVACHG